MILRNRADRAGGTRLPARDKDTTWPVVQQGSRLVRWGRSDSSCINVSDEDPAHAIRRL